MNISGRELIEFISKNHLKIELMDEQAETIIKIIENAGYEIDFYGEYFILKSIDQEGAHIKELKFNEFIMTAAECFQHELMNACNRLDYVFKNYDLDGYINEVCNISKFYKNVLCTGCLLKELHSEYEQLQEELDKNKKYSGSKVYIR